MKVLAVQVAAIGALLAGSASAADQRMPVKAPPPAPVAVYNWTGCYVGAGFGYGMYDQRQRLLQPAPVGQPWDNAGRGGLATVQVGCDYQVASNIVIGAFGDYDWSGMEGRLTAPLLGSIYAEEKLRSSWAAGGRIGWVPGQQTQLLLFVSGGYTEARFNQADYRSIFSQALSGTSLAKHTYSGWFIGAGYEYGLGWLPGLFWKTEYRFADYGTESVPLLFTATGLPRGDSHDTRKYVQTIRSELVWRFNAGGPVVASVADVRRPMAVKAAVAAPVAAYSFTGCYVGAGGGYGIYEQRQIYNVPPVFGTDWDVGGRGWFGTVQGGCDYHVVGAPIVIGAYADYDWSGLKGNVTNPFLAGNYAEEKLKSSWAAGGRIGYVPWSTAQFLVYVSGGYTEARFDQADFRTMVGGALLGISLARHTYNGLFLGAGYEYGLGWLPGLFWKTEYRFADYGTENVPIVFTTTGTPRGDSVDSRAYIQTIRSELVWRFNFGGPVVARY